MRDRNDWGETLAATAYERGERDHCPGAVRGMLKATKQGIVALPLIPALTLSLTAILATSAAPMARAQATPSQTPAPTSAPATDAAPATQDAPPPVSAQAPKGRIRVRVYDATSKFLLDNAAVFIDDPTLNEVRSIPYRIGDTLRRNEGGQPLGGPGFVVTDELAAHQWAVVALKEGYQTGRALVTVLPDQTVDVVIYLRLRERIEPFILLSTRDTTNSTKRTLEFTRNIPAGIGNKQKIDTILATTPGFVRDSLGQVHPRGQRFGLSTSIDGFLLPSLPTGELQGFLPQDVIDTYDIKIGGLSAEYGGDAGAAVNLTTRSIGAIPTVEGMLTVGGYDTDEAYFTVAQRFDIKNPKLVAKAAYDEARWKRMSVGPLLPGASLPEPGSEKHVGPTFGYMLHVSQRNTGAVAESPQKSLYTANNSGTNNLVYGKFEFAPSVMYQITGLVNINGARSGVANRSRDGGVGYLGQLGSSSSDPVQQALINATPSQVEMNQVQFQKENNALSLLQIRRLLRPSDSIANPDSSLTISVGGMDNDIRLENENANVDPRDLTNPSSSLYKRNSSLEFNPTLRRQYNQLQSQVDLVFARRDHAIKAGLLANTFNSKEQYSFQPGSQVALDALFARSPLLTPTSVVPDQSGARDAYGNQIVHYANGATALSPTGRVERSGEYDALYLQDTWRFNQILTINAGVRVDNYTQTSVPGIPQLGIPGQAKTDVNEISPRLNMALQLPKRGPLGFLGGSGLRKSVFRVSYDRLFQRPPLGEGTYFSVAPIRPQTADQWEMGLEKQLNKEQTVKVTTYSTRFQNFLDVTGLFPGAQFSTNALVLVNYPEAQSEGWEIAYSYNPTYRKTNPLTMYASYTNSSTRFLKVGQSFDSLGQLVTADRPSFDQLHTLSIGASYKFLNGSSFGINSYLGSGLYGSKKSASDDPDPIGEVNLRYTTSSRLFHNTFGIELSVLNLLDNKGRYNYFTGMEGLRYQVGRSVLTSVYARF